MEMDDAQRYEEVKAVLQEYAPRFTKFAKQGDGQAALAHVNWEKMQRADTGEEARAIAERVLDPTRSVEVGGNVISF
jgi:hypothetical protein